VLAEAARILGPAGVAAGAQDIFWEDEGAYTGEVGGKIIAEVGGRYAEVGHAERRRVFGEDDDVIGLKTAAAYRNGLTPVLCVGEPDRGTATDATRYCIREIDAVINRAESLGQPGRTIVAYEPQWAIGAAQPATPSFIGDVIRGLDAHLRSRPAQADSRVIYGGSAGPGLIGQLDPAVAGLFLGRFAHDPKAFRSILDETAERLGLLARTEATA
jgi:triosephosphate isomerase